MPLERKYNVDRFFHTEIPTYMWATGTIYRRVKYLGGNQHAQVFSNGKYSDEIYPMAKKAGAGQALKTFVMELGVPEELTVDVSK